MELVTPGIGLIFWTTLIFLLLLILLRKYAWSPILKAVNAREERIKNALEAAEEAHKEMERLKADNDLIIKEAREERNKLIQEAREMKGKIISEAKTESGAEARKIIETARVTIKAEKEAAISELKNQVAALSVEIAEKILQRELESSQNQKKLIEKYLDDFKLN